MSELSCDTLFIGRNETHDLSRYHEDFELRNEVTVTFPIEGIFQKTFAF